MENENTEEVIIEDVDESTENVETNTDDTVALKAQVEALQGRLKRAETKLSKSSKEAPTKQPSNGLDYGQKAFLIANGIKGEAEMKFVTEELKKSGKPLDELLDNKYFKSDLEDMRELAKSAAATPAGKGSNNSSVDSVEYWMTKDIADVPKEMRIQVVNAKLKQEKSGGVFYNS